MEPPCEHGGVLYTEWLLAEALAGLQWSRRVNTAECAASGLVRIAHNRFNGAAV